ncbi:hypothetical protein KEM55_007962 [Ascosphaera atra]|nr:hypothetical protein KEM55_007962 [Ascosphaera atra]
MDLPNHRTPSLPLSNHQANLTPVPLTQDTVIASLVKATGRLRGRGARRSGY